VLHSLINISEATPPFAARTHARRNILFTIPVKGTEDFNVNEPQDIVALSRNS
jgi:hypothetical protein